MATALSNLLALLALDESAYLKGLESSQKATDSFAGNLANVGGAIVVGALTAVATGVIAVGTAAFDAAETVDEAFDSISVATGAQGEELAQLQKDWEAVFTTVPADAGDAANAISILNSRLDITGPALQNLAAPLLEVTRILGGDLKQNAEDFTRVMGDWNLPIEDAPSYLDALYVASQKTGTGLSQLMQQVVQYGAPMRNFGFSFNESVALLAAFESQGVNTEIVMSGLRIAQGKFISQGKDMNTGLWETVDAIQNATSQTDALAIATDIFGAKAAGDMVDTIRAGKFELGGLVDAMQNADGAIMDAANSTNDWAETWKIFTNQMTVKLAPLGEQIRSALGSALDSVIEIFNRPEVQTAMDQFANVAILAISKLVEFLPVAIEGLSNLFTFLQNNQGIVVGIFAALGVAAITWGVVTAAAAWAAIAPMLPVIAVILLIAAAAYLLYEAWTNNWGGIQEITATAIANIMTFIQGVVDFFIMVWQNPLMQAVVQTALSNITALFAAFKAAFSGDWYAFGENLRTIWNNNWQLMGTILSAAWEAIKNSAKSGIDSIKSFFTNANWGEIGRNIILGIVNGLSGAQGILAAAAKSAAAAALQAAKGFLGIKSPSTVFEDEVGANMALGMVRGWEGILKSNPLSPALASATVDVTPASTPAFAVSPQSAAGNSPSNKDALLEDLQRLLRELPDDLARAMQAKQAKGRVAA